jgi:hypothetical protein
VTQLLRARVPRVAVTNVQRPDWQGRPQRSPLRSPAGAPLKA